MTAGIVSRLRRAVEGMSGQITAHGQDYGAVNRQVILSRLR